MIVGRKKYYIKDLVYNDFPTTTLSDLINVYGLKSIVSKMIEKYTIEEILELLDIKNIQQFLRKKKLENIKTDTDV